MWLESASVGGGGTQMRKPANEAEGDGGSRAAALDLVTEDDASSAKPVHLLVPLVRRGKELDDPGPPGAL